MSPCTTTLKPRDAIRKEGSVGRPLINVEVRVVDYNMKDLPVGEVGEIVYRGPNMFKGYYSNPEQTAEAFEGGWFHSGDLVRQDEEGFIYVVDRKKDMIISGGENIYPAEIEEVLYAHPDILEVAIIGVPDEKWGETVKAFIALKEGKSMEEEEVINYCTEHLARYKRPRYVQFVKALPRNAAGKVLKRALREY
jgi:acyl-CoA synthetase (AMP-forming)/AMP-acid ligase II